MRPSRSRLPPRQRQQQRGTHRAQVRTTVRKRRRKNPCLPRRRPERRRRPAAVTPASRRKSPKLYQSFRRGPLHRCRMGMLFVEAADEVPCLVGVLTPVNELEIVRRDHAFFGEPVKIHYSVPEITAE